MKRLFLPLIILIFFASGCKVSKKITSIHEASVQKSDSISHVQKDSIYFSKIETIHDTNFIVKPDSASIHALIRCNQKGDAYLQQIIKLKNGRHISQTISLHNNILTATASIDSAKIYFAWKETHIKETRETQTADIQVKKEKEKQKDVSTTKKTVTRWPVWLYFVVIGAVVFLFVKYILPIILPQLKLLKVLISSWLK